MREASFLLVQDHIFFTYRLQSIVKILNNLLDSLLRLFTRLQLTKRSSFEIDFIFHIYHIRFLAVSRTLGKHEVFLNLAAVIINGRPKYSSNLPI